MSVVKISKRKAALAACLLIIPLLLTGCMPYKEIKDELLVEGIGIDKSEDGYDLTFQIYKPDTGDSQNKEASSNTVEIIECSGTSIFDAVRNATLQYGRKLFFSNTRAFVISEDVCKDDFTNVIDFMQRNHEVRLTEHLFVAKGKAYDIMSFKKDDEIVPAVNLQTMAEEYSQTSKIEQVEFIDILKKVSSNITDASIPVIAITESSSGAEVMEVDGTAVFNEDNFVGYIDKTQTRGLLFIDGLAKGGNIVLALPDGGNANMEIISSSSKISFTGTREKPSIKAEITLKTNITEVQSDKDYTIDDNFISKLIDIQNNTVSSEARSAVDKALHEYGCDIFGFGQKIYQNNPDIWHSIGSNWKTNAKNLKVDITVKSVVTHTGLTNKTSY